MNLFSSKISKGAIAMLGAVLLLSWGPTPKAWAEEAAEKAKMHNATARTLFNVGKFKQAAAEYEKAYQAKPVPEFLHNMAQCYKRLDGIEYKKKALFNFESYLANEPDAANRQEVEEEIAALKRHIEKHRKKQEQAEQDQTLAKKLTVTEEPRSKPIYKKWWFWTAVGAVVAGSVVAIALTTGGDDRVPQGADGSFTPSTF
jgi:tetratricopeptide (TPR) repeat protein